MWQVTTRLARVGGRSILTDLCAWAILSGTMLCGISPAQDSSAEAEMLTPGQLVGQFEIETPPEEYILLRGTLPVPKGSYSPGRRKSPFSIVNQNGVTLETQVDAVTRYPQWEDGADVVELIAWVRRPESASPGDRLVYPIVYRPHRPTYYDSAPDIPHLPITPGQLTIRAWDYFGNRYEADLASNESTETLQRGPHVYVFRTHVTLTPVNPVANGGANDTLPHLMGVHAYFTVRSREPFVEMALRVHNGHSGNDDLDSTDDALSEIFFQRMEIEVPDPYTVIQDLQAPQSGIAVDPDKFWIVEGSTSYPVHYMPKQSQFIRRFAIARDNHVKRARMYLDAHDVAFARPGTDPATGQELYSWWNPETGRYFTQDIALPLLGHETPEQHRLFMADRFDFLSGHYNSGLGGHYPADSDRLGWAHPWGLKDGGVAGGTEIYQFDGLRTMVGASRKGLLYTRLRVQMLTDRNPIALYNKDGAISQVEDWLKVGPNGRYLNCWYFLRPILDGTQQDPFGFTTSPDHQRQAILANNDHPPYYNDLRRFQPTDFQHYTRYNAPVKTLIWQTNDHLAKDQMRMQAEAFRLSYNNYDNTRFGHVIGTGLQYDTTFASDNPGKGLGFGRGEGWGTEAMSAVYAFAPLEWRERMRPWFAQIVDTVVMGQSPCTGIIHSQVQSQGFNGNYRGKQNTEQVIVENALIGMRETVFNDVDPTKVDQINAVLVDSFRGGIVYPSWSNTLHGPWGRLAVGPTDVSSPLFCSDLPSDGQAPWRDNHQSWSSLAHGYKMTGQPIYLQRAEEMAGSGPGPANLLDRLLTADEINWNNQAILISMLERMISGR